MKLRSFCILYATFALGGMLPQTSAFAEEKSSFNQRFDRLAKPIPLYRDLVKIKIGGEFRYRLELRHDFNFNDATYEDDALNLFRTRLNANLDFGPYLRLFAEGQDSESIAQSGLHRTNAFVNRLDLRQLYIELESPWKKMPLSIKVGRQELSYGEERFVGAFGWSNVSRVFDAVKVIYKPWDWIQLDTWFSQVVRPNRNQPDSAAHDDNFYGIYSSLKPFKDHALDTFFLIRHHQNNEIPGEKLGERGQLKEYTFGNRFKGKKWNFDYGIEWAVQFGSRAHNDIRAWAWHNNVGYTFERILWKPRISFEYSHGSGDSDPRDGNFENFDNLFPANHLHYGYIDFASLRNINNIKVGMDMKPHKQLKFSADYHWFFLATNGSAWFNAGQAVIRQSRAGASETLGQELDLLVSYSLSKYVNLLIGYSHFHAGAFVKDTGTHDDANFFYVQTTLKF